MNLVVEAEPPMQKRRYAASCAVFNSWNSSILLVDLLIVVVMVDSFHI